MKMDEKTIERYIEDHTSPEWPLLAGLDRETHLRVVQPRMLSGRVQGRLLEMLARMVAPKYLLEIGTFTGYSALCLARGVAPEGELHTIEVDDERESLAAEYFRRSPDAEKIRLHIGSALDIAPRLGLVFDMVFIDGDKREYPDYYRMLMEGGLVRPGSIIIADNVLWYGKVTGPIPHNDLHTKRIAEFNDMVRDDPRVENVIVPIRDGMTIIRVNSL